jgi:hypothetical protein
MNLTVDIVGETNKELSTSESVDLVINPLLSEGGVLDTLGVSRFVQGLGELEEISCAVEVPPHHLSVVGVVATCEALLTSIVEEGDTSGSQSEGKGALEESLVRVGAQEAGIVVVVHKDTECVDILEVLVVCCPPVRNVSHALSVHPYVSDSEVHRVVEEAGDVVLVGTDISIVSVEVLAHLEDASGCAELRPEVFGDLGDRVDADAVEVVGLDKILNPVFQLPSHIGVALVEVREASESAVLHLPLIVPVVDVTVSVIVLCSVERIDLAVVVFDGAHMVAHDVDHDPDAHRVRGIDHVLECLLPTEVRIDLFPVASPVPVVPTICVIHNR